jgi:hypothetical protein
MRFAENWQNLRSDLLRRRPPQKSRGRLFIESLEERTVPTVIWGSAANAVADYGGPIITHVDVDLIFWGAGWNSAQTPMNNVTSAVTTIMNSPFLSGLSQYRGIGNGQLLRTDLITSTSPAAHTTDAQYDAFVKAQINNGTVPITPKMDSQILYMVIPQPGTTDPAENAGGAHASDLSTAGRFHYGWTINNNSLDFTTQAFSHELTESVTDPEVNYHFGFWVPSAGDEICDPPAQNYTYRLDGVLVQSSLSQKDHAYDVYDGNSQKFFLTSSWALTVNGDQLANPDDTITVDAVNNGYTINLNGEVVQFDSGQIPSITIDTLTGDDTVNIERTVALSKGVTVNLGVGTDTVNLSPAAQNLSHLAAPVTVNGGSGSATLNCFDQGISNNLSYTITSSTVARAGLGTLTYSNMANVALDTSNGSDTITVKSTPAGTALAVNGGTGTNTLVGSAVPNTWNLTGSNAGTLSSASIPGPVSFTAVQNLTGGATTNAFVFSDGASVSGTIQGGGSGSLDYSAYPSDVTVNLQTATATGVGGTIAGIRSLTGGSGNSTLVGADVASLWNVTALNTGTVAGASTVTFAGFQNLAGGAGSNTFVFSDGAGVSGNLQSGGTGSLDYSAYTSDVTVNLQTATATGVGGTFAGIQNLAGGGGNNTLIGADATSAWNVTALNTGNVSGAGTVAFAGFQNLLGGAGGNTFVFSDGAGVSGNLEGGSAGGTLDYSAYSSSVLVDLQTGFAIGVGGSVSAINAIFGGSASPNSNGVYNLMIGAGGDTLTGGLGRRNILVAGASASTLNAGDGEDLLIGGSTTYDQEAGLSSWQLIAAYWAGSDDYATRVDNLMSGSGVLNGTSVPLLDPTPGTGTVIGNGGGNTFNGNGALALFFTDGLDTITGFDPGSQQVPVAP